ncbi:MAG TPA: isocitrate lyase/phosphoenolpyruvate mutase family protein, partial [Solirubrobacterales bacterium]|nr:isocitrate lyase/phosphoenolpyruvate mutase family protein [Solirubrobacterales bacterium]
IQHQKAAIFHALHEGDPFVIPNPWDAGSAKVLAGLGFKALATPPAPVSPSLWGAPTVASRSMSWSVTPAS